MPKVTTKSRPRQSRMDFFLNSSPKKPSSPSRSIVSSSNCPQQTTIQSLTRVVCVDHIVRCRDMLKNEKTEKEVMVSTLEELGEKIPSQEVLKTTKIGYVIRKLLKHEDRQIAKAAKYVYDKWKTFFVDQASKRTIDVKCNTSTENCRRNARKHLAQTLELEDVHPLVINFEREAFHLCKTMTLHQYKRIMRAIILKSRTDDELKKSILEKKRSTKEIVELFK